MLIKLENPVILTKAVEIISDLVMEVRLKVNEFGLSVVAMDPANVSMVAFKLPKSSFTQFEAESETLGVNLDDLKKILKRGGAKSTLIFEKKDNKLEIQIEDRIRRKFSLGLIEIDSEDKSIPSLEFSSVVKLQSVDFVDSVEDCKIVADACSFIVEDGKFVIEAKGINSARAEFSGDEAEIKAEDCKARYSLEYLQKFLKAAKLTDKVVLNFANDHPLRLDVKPKGMEMSFILAPRVETDD